VGRILTVPPSTVQVTLPEMGESVTEGTVAKWLKQVGDSVQEGEGLVEVTTDKVDAEVPSPKSGRLSKILADAGATIAVGAPLAEIEVGAAADKPVATAAMCTPMIKTISKYQTNAVGIRLRFGSYSRVPKIFRPIPKGSEA